jgi:hypothetical protein
MSGTVSSAELILKRTIGYLEDVDHILHHEIITDDEKCRILKQCLQVETMMFKITKTANASCGT